MLELLGRASSINVRKVLWLLAELKLPFTHTEWGAGSLSLQDPAFLALNSNGLVPVLQDGELTLTESNTICRYLAARAGRLDLLPAEPAARAQVEQWMDWQATELNTAWRHAFMGLVRQHPAWQAPEGIAASVQAWNRCMGLLAAQLQRSGSGFVLPQGFTLADVVLGLSTHRWLATPMERPVLPEVAAYYQRLCQRPGFATHGRDGGA
jgi:glutathione S-transferase